ncbi:TPA: ornithine cyclodeaminase family protein [Clostridioides difficile]|nr:ornithine cyclodeaminase family protein [Clostridioides difficile]HBG5847387.1 ornithine cyclodeaminase family protein [Clostridioides difficile]HCU2763200.1 ornithine cyclodeaminase family protein [Clostridioides difficile]
MLLLKKDDIEKVFTMRDAIEADKEAFRIYCEGKSVNPLRTNISVPSQDASMLFMPGYVEELGCGGIKIVSVFPKNAQKGKPVIPATVLLLDGETGEVSAVLDGTYVTQIRTGAASGAAIDVLAKKDSKIGALIGLGGQGEPQLEAMIEARNLDEVRVFSRNKESREKFAEEMNLKLSKYNTKIVAVESSDKAIDNADVIVLATPSKQPVLNGNLVKKGALISAVGSYMPDMQELCPNCLTRASKIFFESTDAVLSESGDILIPLKEGKISKDDFSGDLGNVINGTIPGREDDDEIIVFKTVGIGVQDVVTAKRIYDKAKENGVGMDWKW